MKTWWRIILTVSAVVLLAGCSMGRKEKNTTEIIDIDAVYSVTPVQVDGNLDDAAWADAPVYEMSLGKDHAVDGKTLQQGGKVRFAWDETFFYMGIDFTDSDVVAEGTADGEHHYKMGDLAELFLWPEAHSWYWELYVTPHSKQTSFFFPSKGRVGLPSGFTNHVAMTVAAQVDGTLNDWTDQDGGWTAEIAVPVSALTQYGDAWGPDAPWRILVGRYNYSAYLPAKELSCLPCLSRTSFHLHEEYGRLRLLPR